MSVSVLIFSSQGHQSYGIRGHPVVSFYLNHILKDPVSKYSHVLRSWGLGLQVIKVGGDTVHPLTAIVTPFH